MNPLPPACSPQIFSGNDVSAQNGDAVPGQQARDHAGEPDPRPARRSSVTVYYTGRPGVHRDGDGTTEGWFRYNSPAGRRQLRHHRAGRHRGLDAAEQPPDARSRRTTSTTPSTPGAPRSPTASLPASPTTRPTPRSPAARAPGTGIRPSRSRATWSRTASAPSTSLQHVGADGILYYAATRAAASHAAQKQANLAIMNQQEDMVAFQRQFNGPYPVQPDGVVVGVPQASFQEEMQTKITFNGGRIGPADVPPREHAPVVGRQRRRGQLQPDLLQGGLRRPRRVPVPRPQRRRRAAGGRRRPATRRSSRASSTSFNSNYANTGSLWTAAPSNPTPARLFTTATTYTRPATALIALRQILGKDNFTGAMQKIQRDYGHSTSPRRNWRPPSRNGCRTRAPRAAPASTSSSTSGGTPRMRPAAG